jgi:transcriptional regulator with XRE-family HTH domain
VASGYDFAEQLLAIQRKFAEGLLAATEPLIPVSSKRANLSLRQLAELTSLSNPYLSQVERGLHQPSVRVLKAISGALNVSAETLMTQAGLIDVIAGEATQATDGEQPNVPGTEDAIAADPRLGQEQKAALIAVYRSMLASAPPPPAPAPAPVTTDPKD